MRDIEITEDHARRYREDGFRTAWLDDYMAEGSAA